MWQTEINIFLQSFASTYLTGFFKFITNIGGGSAALAISIIIMFGISFRKGFLLLQMCAFGRCINYILKIIFALPRPVAVDSNVKILWKSNPNNTPLTSMGAKKFFGMLPSETMEYFRIHKLGSFGFPSGASTHAISFWGLIFMIYHKAWVRGIALALILLVPISRIYFGRHFLADVFGSFAVSFILIALFYGLVYKNKLLMRFLFDEKDIKVNKQLIILIIYLFILPFTLLMVPHLTRSVLGPLLGINAGYFILRLEGFPDDAGNFTDRLARVIIAGICYLCFVAGPDKMIKDTLVREIYPLFISVKALGSFLFIWSAMKINMRFGFFK